MSNTIKNIKIPYPQEGVIRSAQLNDTVCPEDSVQLAVNMNFDRIGAIQTRPGVETYATTIDGPVKNFGTLNNSIETNENKKIEQIGVPSQVATFSTHIDYITSSKIDDTHVIVFWRGLSAGGFAQVMEIDKATGVTTPKGTPLQFEIASDNAENVCIRIDGTHFMNVWRQGTSDTVARVFTVNTVTWAVTAAAAEFIVEAVGLEGGTLSQIDANHFLLFYADLATGLGKARVLEVNLTTWVISAPGAALTVDATSMIFNSCASLGDGTHFINFWYRNGVSGYAQVFTVDTGTWGITAEDSPFSYGGNFVVYNSCAAIGDGEHFINFWSGVSADGFTRVFNVDQTTFEVSFAGAELEFDTLNADYNSCVSMGDGIHFVNFWRSTGSIGYTNNFYVDQTTFEITTPYANISLGSVFIAMKNSAVLVDDHYVLNFYKDTSQNLDAVLFIGFGGVVNFFEYLYAQKGNSDVERWDGAAWTSVRTGLATNQKARFAQFLNYLWMVNGNEQTGDPVMVSDGGAFTTTGVPTGLPQGDFISAGFDGRIWIADSITDTLYFTDIVQFTPPVTYTITYTSTNFMKNFSPQDGQSITGLFRVPKALLLFKENSIFRVYGAYATDPYPAYNVGTYSQESIVQAKDGTYFHHSSGFYKFSFDSQPIEISRRVIDFVKAIPRENYENVVGIYDGFDSVKWSVGSVTVEGVTFTNCQMRYTISTQVWTIYDFTGNDITALIRYDNGTTVDQIVGTAAGKIGKLDSGLTDFGAPIYFEMIDRWRSFTEMYSRTKSLSGLTILSENGGGTLVQYQSEKTPVNAWHDIDTVKSDYATLFPNANTSDFNTIRLRYRGYTSGAQMSFHGVEVLSIQDKGLEEN